MVNIKIVFCLLEQFGDQQNDSVKIQIVCRLGLLMNRQFVFSLLFSLVPYQVQVEDL